MTDQNPPPPLLSKRRGGALASVTCFTSTWHNLDTLDRRLSPASVISITFWMKRSVLVLRWKFILNPECASVHATWPQPAERCPVDALRQFSPCTCHPTPQQEAVRVIAPADLLSGLQMILSATSNALSGSKIAIRTKNSDKVHSGSVRGPLTLARARPFS